MDEQELEQDNIRVLETEEMKVLKQIINRGGLTLLRKYVKLVIDNKIMECRVLNFPYKEIRKWQKMKDRV